VGAPQVTPPMDRSIDLGEDPMQRIFRRINPYVAAAVVASFMAPSLAAAQSTVRGYFDFFDNMCYPCTGPMEPNEFCTCQAKVQDQMAMQTGTRG
jgi:hypothetical protein